MEVPGTKSIRGSLCPREDLGRIVSSTHMLAAEVAADHDMDSSRRGGSLQHLLYFHSRLSMPPGGLLLVPVHRSASRRGWMHQNRSGNGTYIHQSFLERLRGLAARFITRLLRLQGQDASQNQVLCGSSSGTRSHVGNPFSYCSVPKVLTGL